MTGRVFDVVVVGGGHAGVEAALAAARMGAPTALVTMAASAIGRMSCNPAIGGLGKGQMVCEIDALGGEMGKAADAAGIQFRLLNTSKGPAARAPRAQCDSGIYQRRQQGVCTSTADLVVIEGTVADIDVEPVAAASRRRGESTHRVTAARLGDGSRLPCRALVLTAGTFLRGLMHRGEAKTAGGRVGEKSSDELSVHLEELGFQRGRLKTGTPPRVDRRTVDFSRTELQPGDETPVPFSFFTDHPPLPQVPCHIAHTGKETHEVILENLHRAPMYNGQIGGVGPRYCPSIEDKVVRFADRERHQIFLEPEGLDSDRIYLNGISTSLPDDVQERIVASIPALKDARILQYGYAVEYDFFPATQVDLTLQTRTIEGLFLAGQICGTSGYEEAAAQGFLAGVNAVQGLRDGEPLVLGRDRAYIGVLVDDLVMETPLEPYRMFSSRAEYRLLLRADNADLRLMEIGHRLGLVPAAAMRKVERKRASIAKVMEILPERHHHGKDLLRLLRQPGRRFEEIRALDRDLAAMDLPPDTVGQIEIEARYATYIERQRSQIEKFRRLESRRIPEDFSYRDIPAIRLESREKLQQLRPRSLGQVARVPGVTPADVHVIMAYLESRREGVGVS